MKRLVLLVLCVFPLAAFADEPALSKILRIKSYPFHTNAQQDPDFATALKKKNLKTLELIEKITAAISRGEVTRDSFTQIAFAETLDCGGACFSFVPFSSEVSWVEVSLCKGGLENICQLSLHSHNGAPLASKADLERTFGKSGDCLSYAMDTNQLICQLNRIVNGTAADVSIFWVKRPDVPDEPITEIHLRVNPRTPITEPKKNQEPPSPLEQVQPTPTKPAEYNPLSTPTAKLYFVGVIFYSIVPLYFFYRWRNKRLKNKKAKTNPIISGILGLILNLSISYYGTKMWADGKQFYDMGGTALIFVFLFIFILAGPISAIVTQLLLDIRAK